jgi:sodium transport system permease protein
MRLSIVRTILFKELRETLRDRRTLLMTVGLPVLLYPLVILAFTRIAESGEDAIAAGSSLVAVWGELPAPVEQALRGSDEVTLLPWAGAPPELRAGLAEGVLRPLESTEEDSSGVSLRRNRQGGTREIEPENPVLAAARTAVASRAVQAVIVTWPDTGPALARGDAAPLTVYYDSVRRDSAVAQSRVMAALDLARDAIVTDRQRARGLPDGFSAQACPRISNSCR